MARAKGKGASHCGDNGDAQGVDAFGRRAPLNPANQSTQYAIADIKVGTRHRRALGDIEGLADSIADFGLLHPITIDENGWLLAGMRRLAACKHLGWTEIPVNVVGCDDDVAS